MADGTRNVEEGRWRFMSKLADLQSRMRSLQDIDAILNAMKNLSLVEITKISRFYATQQELFRAVESALADFQQFYGVAPRAAQPVADAVFVLIGSERGFCGGFNEAIQKRAEGEASAGASLKLVVIGRKLALKFQEDKRVLAFLDGPSAAEEIPAIISRLAKVLAQSPESVWKIIHNSYNNQGTRVEVKCPFEFSGQTAATKFQFAPLLNMAPSELRSQLFEQYLFGLFYGIFYLSFMAENHERLRHMDGALNKLREDEQRLRLFSNSLRQEAITEEIEVIMLSVDDSISKGRER
jgi:F-type H+-transporting ATPase subunit gamma